MQPLAGITVVALEQAVAAPLATRHLADLGARVIKLERPRVGDFARGYDTSVKGMASFFVWLNRSKESLTLDLKHPEARVILETLLSEADVFVQNLAPGAADRLGLDPPALQERCPRLIVCGISGYGTSGPYRDKKAYDLLVQCETGLVSITGTPDTPSKVGISVADIAAGMYAYSGILTTLFQRERTGAGTSIEVSLFDALAEWMGYPAYYAAYSGSAPSRAGASHASIVPYGPFATGDGEFVNLAVQNEREWSRFCDVVLDQPELASDPRFSANSSRVSNRDELHAIITGSFHRLTTAKVVELLDRAQIANARMNSIGEFLDHPQLAARDRWRQIASPVGPLRALLPPVSIEGVEYLMGAIPALGEHTSKILHSIGYPGERIEQLRLEGAI